MEILRDIEESQVKDVERRLWWTASTTANVWQRVDLPITEQMANTILSLPIGPHMQMSEVDRVIQALTLDANG